MAFGAFLISREIFDSYIYTDITKFRVFFHIIGHAVFAEEGVKKGNIHIKRGQYLRSLRNLREDLVYFENNSEKMYSLSTLNRKIGELVEEGRLKVENTKLGTLFTVVNYAQYQDFGYYKSDNSERKENSIETRKEQEENVSGTEGEQQENGSGTQAERCENNNNKVNKVINVKQVNNEMNGSKANKAINDNNVINEKNNSISNVLKIQDIYNAAKFIFEENDKLEDELLLATQMYGLESVSAAIQIFAQSDEEKRFVISDLLNKAKEIKAAG